MTIVLPEPRQIVELTMEDGAIIRVRRYGDPDGPRIVMSHGNGMGMNAYAQFWEPLCDRYDIVLFDFRDHGENPFHRAESHNYAAFVRDMEAVHQGISRHLGDKPTAGAFHSLSAIACAAHGLAYGKRWDAVVLFDPPFHPDLDHPFEPTFRNHMNAVAGRARRRPERYPTVEAFADQLKNHGAYRRWVPGSHKLFAAATLRRDREAGDYVLACPRELEAAIFVENSTLGLWRRMSGFPRPTFFICGDPDAEFSTAETTASGLMAREAGIDYVTVPSTDHFLQLERPEEAAAMMCDFLARHGFAP